MPEHSEQVHQLAEHYRVVLGLYRELEELSQRIFDAFQDPSRAGGLTETLKAKLAVVTRIQEESRLINGLKAALDLSESERDTVRRAENQLTDLVKRVVEHEDRSRNLFARRGVRISRI